MEDKTESPPNDQRTGNGGDADTGQAEGGESSGPLARFQVAEMAGRVRERPWLYAGIAAGCGFVLGGGLATPLAARLLRRGATLALRLSVAPAVARLEKVVLRALDVDVDDDDHLLGGDDPDRATGKSARRQQ